MAFENNPYSMDNAYGSAVRSSAATASLMTKVYLWMALGLTITALSALYVAGQENLVYSLAQNNLTLLALIIGEVALVWTLSSRILRMSLPVAGLMFALYSILNGITLSFIFVVYSLETISTTFFVTAGMFGAMALTGSVVKRDLSGMGRFLMMTLFGVLIASVVNIFVGSSALYWGISYLGVILFAGLTAYDAQKIKVMLQQYGGEVNDETMKLSLLGSLTLYLDFVNLFLFLLRIFGASRD